MSEKKQSMVFPENTIWYVQAKPKGCSPVEGSAVAIRLQKKISQDGNANGSDLKIGKIYLLTCAHVLRGRASYHAEGDIDGSGYGAIASDIKVWPPGVGFNEAGAKTAIVCKELCAIDLGEIPYEKRGEHINDWVILEITDLNATQGDGITSDVWGKDTSPHFLPGLYSERYEIIGYPGGNESFTKGITKPTRSSPVPFKDEEDGLLVLNGHETRAGMSGGGVFKIKSLFGKDLFGAEIRLVGIHRGRNDGTMQIRGLSGDVIKAHIESDDVPYTICPSRKKRGFVSSSIWSVIVIVVLALLVVSLFPWPTPPPGRLRTIDFEEQFMNASIRAASSPQAFEAHRNSLITETEERIIEFESPVESKEGYLMIKRDIPADQNGNTLLVRVTFRGDFRVGSVRKGDKVKVIGRVSEVERRDTTITIVVDNCRVQLQKDQGH